jgi:hypothetical protein
MMRIERSPLLTIADNPVDHEQNPSIVAKRTSTEECRAFCNYKSGTESVNSKIGFHQGFVSECKNGPNLPVLGG